MSGERRLQYEKGPSLEDEERAVDETDERDAGDEAVDSPRAERPIAALAPWKAGALSGVSAFWLVFTVSYQLAGAMFATGVFVRVENEPAQWAIAGLTMLGSHGATIEEGGAPIPGAYAQTTMLVSHVSVLVPVVVLAVAGYLLVRYVRLETREDAGLAIGALTLSYLVLAIVLARIATWAPQEQPAGATTEPSTVAVVIDGSLFLSVGGTVLAFATLGAAVAAFPRLLERAPVETGTETAE